MNRSRLLGALCACVLCLISMSSHAALLTRLDGQAVYDTDLDISFIADAIYSSIDLTEERISEIITTVGSVEGHTLTTDDFITGGPIVPTSWWGAMAWADQLVFGGHSDWRLPKTIAPDNNCSDYSASGKSIGYDCTASELGHFYYDELGGVGGTHWPPLVTKQKWGSSRTFSMQYIGQSQMLRSRLIWHGGLVSIHGHLTTLFPVASNINFKKMTQVAQPHGP